MKTILFIFVIFIMIISCNNDYMELLKDGDYKKTINVLTRKIELDTTNSTLYYYRAIAYSNLKEYDMAKKDLEKSIKFGEKNIPAYMELGKIYYATKNFEKAHDIFLTVNLIDSKNDSDYYLALCYYNLEMYEKAVSYCQTSIKKYPQKIKNYFLFNKILQKIETVPPGQ